MSNRAGVLHHGTPALHQPNEMSLTMTTNPDQPGYVPPCDLCGRTDDHAHGRPEWAAHHERPCNRVATFKDGSQILLHDWTDSDGRRISTVARRDQVWHTWSPPVQLEDAP